MSLLFIKDEDGTLIASLLVKGNPDYAYNVQISSTGISVSMDKLEGHKDPVGELGIEGEDGIADLIPLDNNCFDDGTLKHIFDMEPTPIDTLSDNDKEKIKRLQLHRSNIKNT